MTLWKGWVHVTCVHENVCTIYVCISQSLSTFWKLITGEINAWHRFIADGFSSTYNLISSPLYSWYSTDTKNMNTETNTQINTLSLHKGHTIILMSMIKNNWECVKVVFVWVCECICVTENRLYKHLGISINLFMVGRKHICVTATILCFCTHLCVFSAFEGRCVWWRYHS